MAPARAGWGGGRGGAGLKGIMSRILFQYTWQLLKQVIRGATGAKKWCRREGGDESE